MNIQNMLLITMTLTDQDDGKHKLLQASKHKKVPQSVMVCHWSVQSLF